MCGFSTITMFDNVLLLVSDSLREDFVATSRTDTPTLDRIREQGVTFTRARSPGPGTAVSMPAILSGSFPFTHGYINITPEHPAVAPRLSENGFSTAGFHSNGWCDANHGYDRGFDRLEDIEVEQTDGPLTTPSRWLIRELSSGFPNFPNLTKFRRTGPMELITKGIVDAVAKLAPAARNDVTADASSINDRLVEWIQNSDSPRFGWAQYMDTHFPYMPPDSDYSRKEQIRLNYRMTRNRVSDKSITPKDQRSILDLYSEEINYLDSELQKLFQELEDQGELSKTLIIFTADHGELLGENGKFAHKSARLDSPLTHVPLVVWAEDLPSRWVHEPVSLVDIVPTVYDYFDIVNHSSVDGCSLRPVIEGDDTPKTPAISEMGHDPQDFQGPPSKDTAVVSIETERGLFTADWLNGDVPTTSSDESELLYNRRSEIKDTGGSNVGKQLQDDSAQKRLKDLGYLE